VQQSEMGRNDSRIVILMTHNAILLACLLFKAFSLNVLFLPYLLSFWPFAVFVLYSRIWHKECKNRKLKFLNGNSEKRLSEGPVWW
jgi:hypothetical protein